MTTKLAQSRAALAAFLDSEKPATPAPAKRQAAAPASQRLPYGMNEDGTARCINAEPGTFNHECGKPATWIGSRRTPRRASPRDGAPLAPACFCDECKAHGAEAGPRDRWEPITGSGSKPARRPLRDDEPAPMNQRNRYASFQPRPARQVQPPAPAADLRLTGLPLFDAAA